jgi:transcriptional regulator with XRE-family HTH domain
VNFKEATDVLTHRVTAEEIAEAAGVSVSTIARARLDQSSSAHRSPPPSWQSAVVDLAKRRRVELDALIARLEGK